MKLNEENYVSAAEDVIQRLKENVDRNGNPRVTSLEVV